MANTRRKSTAANYKTYYETGSIEKGTKKFYIGKPTTLTAAIRQACALSRKTKGYVAVMRGGIEVATCYRGIQATQIKF